MARDTVAAAAPAVMKPGRPCVALILTRIVQNRKGEETNVPVVAIPPITLPGDPPTTRGGIPKTADDGEQFRAPGPTSRPDPLSK